MQQDDSLFELAADARRFLYLLRPLDGRVYRGRLNRDKNVVDDEEGKPPECSVARNNYIGKMYARKLVNRCKILCTAHYWCVFFNLCLNKLNLSWLQFNVFCVMKD